MKNSLRRYSQIIFFVIFILLLIQTEYKGTDQLGTPVRFFLGLDPLIGMAVLTAAQGILLYILGLAVGLGIVYGAAWLAKKLLPEEKWNDSIETVLTRYIPLALITGFFTWAIFPFGIDRGFAWVMALGVITVAVTLLLGRVFCGWVCPMGAVLQFFSWIRKEPRKRRIAKNQFKPTQYWKYYILIGILVMAVLGFQLVGIMDPISLVIRGFGLVVSPVVNMVVNGVYDFAYETGNDTVIGVADEMYRAVGYPNVLSFSQPHFAGVLLVAAMFIGVIALNWIRPRFWCRVLCPLGALLGTISRSTPYRLQMTKSMCSGCGACSYNCQGACDPEFKEGWRPAECFVCFYCVDSCPSGALKFSFTEKETKVPEEKRAIGLDIPRRRALQAAGTALVAVPLLKATEIYKEDVGGATSGPSLNNPELIRPPGALPEDEFLDRCIRCGECMKVCPTNGLHPTTLEAGPEGMWTPILIPQLGYCEYYCTLCGQVCPTGAIQELSVEEKTKTHIGTAFFDVDRCLPYAFATPCIVCEEHCPTAPKAIWFEEVPRASRPEDGGFAPNAADPYGSNPANSDPYGNDGGGGQWASATEQVDPADENVDDSYTNQYQDPYGGTVSNGDTVLQPKIDLELCIGCGICEKVCVVADTPAVRITAVGESRSQTNRIRFEGSYEG